MTESTTTPPNAFRGASEVPRSRIEALIRLLGDEDPKIWSVAWDNLERIGAQALPALEQARAASGDARVRVQSDRFLREWSRRLIFERWVQFCQLRRFDLEEGAFLIAESEYPDLETPRYKKTLDDYARVLGHRLATARTTDEAVARISTFLFTEAALRGNVAEYYDPENSYLNRVLDRRRGIPITLSIIFLLVARRLAVQVQGVGMPQHFLLKYRGAAGEVFVDAFHAGKTLSARDCARHLAEMHLPFREEFLRAVSDQEILSRMLGNLFKIYLAADDKRRSERIALMLKLLG